MLKEQYYHYRIPEDYTDLKKGFPPLPDLYLYNRKQQQFMNPYERQFFPFERGGMTECVLSDVFGNRFTGYAFCSMSDNFCYATGRKIAYERAYKYYIDNVPY